MTKKLRNILFVLLVVIPVLYSVLNDQRLRNDTQIAETTQQSQVTPSSNEKTNSIDKAIDSAKKATQPIKDEVNGSDYVNKAKSKVSEWLKGDENITATSENNSELANLEYNGQASVPVNNGKSTLDWNWTTNKIDYSPLDELNRMGKATAYIDKKNYGASEGRAGQVWQPTGWNNQNRNQDRGHGVAYTLSFNFNEDGVYTEGELGSIDNPKNLFTQTSQSNRGEMQNWEEIVREAIKQNKKVIYEVTPIFKGEELMARGVHVQAISEDGSVNFNQYIFNVDDDYNFDYATGRSTKK